MSPRHVIVVGTATTGRDAEVHVPVEVAWWNLDLGVRGCFIPPHEQWLDTADPETLRLNRYSERLAGRVPDLGYEQARVLHTQLRGNVLAGADPRFEAAMLTHLFTEMWLQLADDDPGSVARRSADPMWLEPWHHRLLDLPVYATGVLGLNPGELPGLDRVHELLGMTPDPARVHDAGHDVAAAAACFTVLMAKAGAR